MKTKFMIVLILSTFVPILSTAQTFDGPAELPRTVPSIVVVSPNAPKVISANDNFQAALNGATCGDNFLVDPSLIYTVASKMQLPTLSCDSQHWITIQNSGLTVIDATTRIHPGVPMPKIILSPGVRIVGGAFVALIGFEITRLDGSAFTGAFIAPGVGAHDLVFDRNYCHGTPTSETVRCLDLSSVPNVAVINNYISDFHCLSPGSCGDAQAIAGGFGTTQDGNYLIQNNYLEASGENVAFGGSSATVVPTDITIRWNDFYKPMSWNPKDPSYAPVNGLPWTTKNLFELKTGRRVLLEGNRMQNTWGGFSQSGTAIVITPKNQGGQCTVCAVEDITIRDNWISKTGTALALVYTSTATGAWAAAAGRWSVHDNLFDGLIYANCYGCTSYAVGIYDGDVPSPGGVPLHDVTVDHNTFLAEGGHSPYGFLMVGGPTTGLINIKYTNNVQPYGVYGVSATDWKATNCSYGQQGKTSLFTACWTGDSTFTGNVLLAPGVNMTAATKLIPAGNYLLPVGVNPVPLQGALAQRKF